MSSAAIAIRRKLNAEKAANSDLIVAIKIDAPSGSESCNVHYFQGKYSELRNDYRGKKFTVYKIGYRKESDMSRSDMSGSAVVLLYVKVVLISTFIFSRLRLWHSQSVTLVQRNLFECKVYFATFASLGFTQMPWQLDV